ncbi:dTDP-4-dehydrorhamnose 3,5-epimerase [Sulfurifustis variabilis]|uniref:dTDP-4-dehydrorhamnose 3,5-epimerase n=1 Tax=Sulfurifustis variabilis TaxID=1675686 RepID=A0A1B4V3E1_9GAMM|nr:dTDP-4-dehydrorhamnose 3,5-epimerase [Sulfurifustis variabilis]BAU48080.1 dTDP-4-dehydrorhamnose 3,5-epimerase [Sulfurifustis variabilis]
MRFIETSLPGAWVIEPEPHYDERGFFARTWCEREFREHGIAMAVRQCNLSGNRARGILRGLHYQASPHAEAKVVSCLRGAIHDVIVDLRPDSPSFKRHAAVELSPGNGRMLYVPPGMAHGYQTLTDDALVHYLMSEHYVAEAQRGVRWDDPAFGIEWPAVEARIISARDLAYPDFLG